MSVPDVVYSRSRTRPTPAPPFFQFPLPVPDIAGDRLSVRAARPANLVGSNLPLANMGDGLDRCCRELRLAGRNTFSAQSSDLTEHADMDRFGAWYFPPYMLLTWQDQTWVG